MKQWERDSLKDNKPGRVKVAQANNVCNKGIHTHTDTHIHVYIYISRYITLLHSYIFTYM